jgi:predicted amidohydrolase YtcJ
VECGVYAPHLDDAIARGLRSGDVLPDTSGLVTMGPLKVITDGSLNTRTAYCYDPYPGLDDSADAFGMLVVAPTELAPLMRRARENAIECAIHAIGDHANTLALDAFEETGARGTIEHAQLLDRADLKRFHVLGVAASVQPSHAVDDRDVADRHWPGRTERSFPYGDLLAAGATLRFGSDAPVAPLDPWHTMAAAVQRSHDSRAPWHPEQAVSVEAALSASTRGRFAVRDGDAADLVVTELDPLAASADQLRAMPVHATMVGGAWTFRRGE